MIEEELSIRDDFPPVGYDAWKAKAVADLRGLAPAARAQRIIDNCAHPAYRDYLHKYIEGARQGHIRHDLARCFELHQNLIEHGAMLPDLDLSQFGGAPA